MIEVGIEGKTFAAGSRIVSLNIDLPVSDSDQKLLLFVSYVQYQDNNAGINTPSGWTSIGAYDGLTFGVAAYQRTGGIVGSTTITFSTNPVVAVATCFTITNQKSSSIFTGFATGVGTGGATSHLVNSATNSAFANSMFIGAVTTLDSNRGFLSANGQEVFDEDGFMVKLAIPPYVGFGFNALNVAYKFYGTSGVPGTLNWQSSIATTAEVSAATSGMIGFWIAPSQAPSAPVVVAPVVNERITSGRTYTLINLSASDPAIASSSLTYAWEYTDTHSNTWTSIGTTSAGVLTKSWNTSGLAAGTYQVRVRANNGTDNGAWGYSDEFSLLTDTVPGAPFNLAPNGYISKSSNQNFTWTANNPDADTQKAYELRYSVNADMSSSTTVSATTATAQHTFTANTDILSSTGTKYWQVRTKGEVDNTFGDWSQVQTVIVSTPPSAPNITAPTAGSPPTVAKPTVTFTGAHLTYRHVWIKGGIEFYNQIVNSSQSSFLAPLNLANGETWTLKISIFDATGLESSQDSETFTVSYTGPAKPTITVTALDEQGKVQIAVVNSDTVDHTRILRYRADLSETIDDAKIVSPHLPNDATFLDSWAESGISYDYVARSFKPTTLGFTDSDPSAITQTLASRVFIDVVTKTSTSANSSLGVAILTDDGVKKDYIKKQLSKGMVGRTKRLTFAGQNKYLKLNYSCYIPTEEASRAETLQSIFNLVAADPKTVLCVRDSAGNKIFAKFTKLPLTDFYAGNIFTLEFTEIDFREAIR